MWLDLTLSKEDTGNLIASELKSKVSSDISSSKAMNLYLIIILVGIIILTIYSIFVIGSLFPSILLSIVIVGLTVIIILENRRSVTRIRARIFENGFIPSGRSLEQGKMKKIICYNWHSVSEVKKTEIIWNPNKWIYIIKMKDGTTYSFDYKSFPKNKRKTIKKKIDRVRLGIVTTIP